MSRMRYLQALAKALRDEMERDDSLFVVGEDVRESLRGVTKGLAADFDDRVLDMPISEQMFTSFATGGSESSIYTTTDPVRPMNLFSVPRGAFFGISEIDTIAFASSGLTKPISASTGRRSPSVTNNV